MIATRTCSAQFRGLLAARKLVTTNLVTMNARRPSSLLSSSSSTYYNNNDERAYSKTSNHKYQPMGDLFQSSKKKQSASTTTSTSGAAAQDFVGKTASISRVFGAGANAQALLTCGGEELAQHASFDPNYENAKDWIRSRPVGPAVLSSTLISGLVGALIEASFPQTVPRNSSINFLRPLIVGMEVAASIKVESVNETQRDDGSKIGGKNGNGKAESGYEILLSTQVIRVQDDVVIAEGCHTVWIPGYL